MLLLVMMFLLIFLLSFFLLLINLFMSKKEYIDREKLSSFECGFEILSSSRLPFSIHFFMIGILFLVFDVEIVFLFSLIDLMMNLNFFEWFYITNMIIIILYFGLEFEKKEGSLKWVF